MGDFEMKIVNAFVPARDGVVRLGGEGGYMFNALWVATRVDRSREGSFADWFPPDIAGTREPRIEPWPFFLQRCSGQPGG